MPLSPGEQLGPYEIVSLLGKGGMGEVYKARDPRLQRDVAIKTSAQRFSERFQIEARAIAALNHPNICQIFDVGPNYIVMEYVEGVSPKGPLDVNETLRLAEQIAAALEEAHGKKITHRDLKPGNILVKADGTVKVLDFGLAKFGTTDTSVAIGEDSPTLTMAATQAGTILGTAHYMSPEQARGKPVDTRADIWSFGVIVYELATGHKPFTGEDLADTLASVVKLDPDFTRVPQRVRRLVQACLQKDPQQRLQHIGDMRLLLDAESAPGVALPERKPGLLWPALAGAFAIAAAATGWMLWRAPVAEYPSSRFVFEPPEGEVFNNAAASFSVSPDGRYIVFAARAAENTSTSKLWIRPIDSLEARPLPATEGQVNHTFWSPDSRTVAYVDLADRKLKRVDISGGAAITLTDANNSLGPAGSWNREGIILFGSAEGIRRASATPGPSSLVTKTDTKKESAHAFPQFLPDAKRFLFYVESSDVNVHGVYASSLDAPEQRKLIVNTNAKAVYVPPKGPAPGYLLWVQDDNLVAQRFDLDALERQGEPVSVAEGLSRPPPGNINARAAFWASDAGVLLYRDTPFRPNLRRIVWMDRTGKILSDAVPPGNVASPALSPDGTRLAFERIEPGRSEDIVVWEFSRSVGTKLTFGPEPEYAAVWSPGSKYVAYVVEGQGVFRMDASGAGKPEILLPWANSPVALDWSRDGKYLLYSRTGSAPGRDLWVLPLTPDAKPAGKPLAIVTASANQTEGRFSPNGRWLAYTSNESGQSQLFIQPFAPSGSSDGPGGRWAAGAGGDPAWADNGRELFFETSAGDIMAVAIREEGAGLKVDAAKLLFKAGADVRVLHSIDTRDGQKFIVQLPDTGPAPSEDTAVTVVTNWQSALRK